MSNFGLGVRLVTNRFFGGLTSSDLMPSMALSNIEKSRMSLLVDSGRVGFAVLNGWSQSSHSSLSLPLPTPLDEDMWKRGCQPSLSRNLAPIQSSADTKKVTRRDGTTE